MKIYNAICSQLSDNTEMVVDFDTNLFYVYGNNMPLGTFTTREEAVLAAEEYESEVLSAMSY